MRCYSTYGLVIMNIILIRGTILELLICSSSHLLVVKAYVVGRACRVWGMELGLLDFGLKGWGIKRLILPHSP